MRFSRIAAIAAALGFGMLSVSAVSAGDLSARTRKNLETAMHGEAFANLKYRAYAEMARESGKPELAKTFEQAANVEANEHFAREADALKLAKSNEANLKDAAAGEHYENTKMYKEFAAQARADGDVAAAKLFEQIAADEGDHYAAYEAALKQLQGKR
ncbi:rubrerythrin family protein [Rhizomicrobium electricum]|jgi:rubrerythrin|uniref:Ferritin-like diiron domain-containing protein n=1 Tax=Rhizomicrobium electricum TaxID=480070 RepID=A0ABN1FA51_9PROT|nr:rubrerythrin family protein [Rhizomicrobium electricum]NIJ50647.1 rubrerythrin [Rhizomicrobium electricum]